MKTLPPTLSPDGLRTALRAFCEKHPIRRLDVFGSAARGQAGPRSDVDLLVTLDDSVPVSTLEILEMAGEAEELVGVPVDFVLRQALDQSPNGFAREHILATKERSGCSASFVSPFFGDGTPSMSHVGAFDGCIDLESSGKGVARTATFARPPFPGSQGSKREPSRPESQASRRHCVGWPAPLPQTQRRRADG